MRKVDSKQIHTNRSRDPILIAIQSQVENHKWKKIGLENWQVKKWYRLCYWCVVIIFFTVCFSMRSSSIDSIRIRLVLLCSNSNKWQFDEVFIRTTYKINKRSGTRRRATTSSIWNWIVLFLPKGFSTNYPSAFSFFLCSLLRVLVK